MMNIEQFAAKYGLKTREDEDGTTIIPGRRHRLRSGKTAESINHIYEYGDGLLGVMVGVGTPRMWNFKRRLLTAIGMQIVQDGDSEGSATFDPTNQAQAKVAIREARVKPRKVLSQQQADQLQRARESSPLMRQMSVKAKREPKRLGEG